MYYPPIAKSKSYAFQLIFSLIGVLMLFSGCQKEDAIKENEATNMHPAAIWAKKLLPETTFSDLDWQKIQSITQNGNLNGWIVKPFVKDEDKIEAYFIKAVKGLPAEIIYNQISLKNKIVSNNSSNPPGIQSLKDYKTLELKQKSIVGKKEKTSVISLIENPSIKENVDKRSRVSKKSLVCETCPTLPDVVVYGKKKRRPVLVNMSAFDPDAYDLADVVYVPVDDLNAGGGSLLPGEGAYESLSMSQFTYYDFVQNGVEVSLYTNEYYPGKDVGFPWRWWVNAFTPQEQQAIDLVKQEFEEEAPTTASCKGTQRFAGRSSYVGIQ
jgi:hypothetical protein